MSEASDGAEVGSFAEEAGRLFGALSGWAREHAGEAGEGLTGLAEHAAASTHDLNDHLSTGGAECTVCPICRGVHAIRKLNPEVKAHLGAAAVSLFQAATTLMDTKTPESTQTASDIDDVERGDEWPEDA